MLPARLGSCRLRRPRPCSGPWIRAWEEEDLDKRRSILKAVVDRIVVKPVGKGVHHFDPDSVEIV
jgi:hypothetical protein